MMITDGIRTGIGIGNFFGRLHHAAAAFDGTVSSRSGEMCVDLESTPTLYGI